MPQNDPSPAVTPPWHPAAPEAQRLAEALRGCRLTLLIGAAGAGKTALLTHGVLPLLRRRAVDAAVTAPRGDSPVILPFPERRSRARARLAEIVIHADEWAARPLSRLHDAIDAALHEAQVEPEMQRKSLADRAQGLGTRFGTRLLFVFDRFEELLRAPHDSAERERMLDQLAQMLNQRLPANVLIALRSDAQAQFEPFGDRLYNVDAEVLQLPHWDDSQAEPPAPPLYSVPGVAVLAVPAPATAADSASPVRREDIYAAIETTLARTAGVPLPAVIPIAAPPREGSVPSAAAPVGPPAPNLPAPAPRWHPPVVRTGTPPWRRPSVAVAVLAMVVIGLGVSWNALPPELPTVARPTDVPAVVRAADVPVSIAAAPNGAALLPALDLQIDDDGAPPPRLPGELARALAADGGVELRIGTAPASLGLLRYDALQAAARQAPKPTLAVVAPLYTEEVIVVVRADSPLRFIHEIEGKRLNVGAASAARALTATALYRRMFGKALPAAIEGRRDAPAALQLLARGAALDAVVLVAPQPADALSALPAETRRGLRVLGLDAANPASRKALQAYLPATLRKPEGLADAPAPVPTLAALTFLVTTGAVDAAQTDALERLARSLCRSLPGLQRDGDAKWREVRPGFELDTGWPTAAATAAAWRACTDGGAGAAATPLPR